MKAVSWPSLVAIVTNGMFVRDTDGRTVFFPWGLLRKGYLLKSARRKSTIARFYTGSAVLYFAALAIVISGVKDFWPIVEALVACSTLWLLTWFVYAWTVTRSLSVAHESYSDIVLKKLSQDTSEYVPTPIAQSQARQSYVSSPTSADFLLPLKALYYHLSPTQLAAASWVVLVIVGLIWYQFRPTIFEGQSGNYLGAALLCFFAGLGSFFIGWRAETTSLWQFINWRLPHILIAITCWGGVIYLIFRYFVR